MSFTVGIDVGGTNTDVAIIDGNQVVGWSKSPTTEKIIDGVILALKLAFEKAKDRKDIIQNIKRVNIGTTHFINAVIKRKGLTKVSCIRLCGVASHCLPPYVDFPTDLREQIDGGYHMLDGGFEFNLEPITEFNETEVIKTIEDIKKSNIKHIAVAGIFSPTNSSHEKKVGELIERHYPAATFTLSHQLGHLGLIERENACILNESLKELCKHAISGFKTALIELGLNCPIFFTQNDGTLISEERTLKFPVYTFSSGATNSMRGAAHLSQVKDAIIVDIGGTSTDVGVLSNGFPREASTRVQIGGVNTNFRMPDTKSIGLGGGSIIDILNEEQGLVNVRSDSVEYNILHEARIFGGRTLVATDIAVACGIADVGDKSLVSNINENIKQEAMRIIQEKVEEAVDSVKLSDSACVVVLVGGGSVLIDEKRKFIGAESIIKPAFYQVANAVGAALSKVSGTIDKLVTITEDNPRELIIATATKEATDIAVANGALRDTCQLVNLSEVQMSYMAVPCMRLKLKVVGDLERNDSDVTIDLSNAEKEQGYFSTRKKEEVTKSINPKDPVKSKFTPDERSRDILLDISPPVLTAEGDWILRLDDVDCLVIGAGILGCGGGGSPYQGKLKLRKCIQDGLQVKIIHPLSLPKDHLAYGIAFMGAPEIILERISNGRELSDAVKRTQELHKQGFQRGMTKDKVDEIVKKNELEMEESGSGECSFVRTSTPCSSFDREKVAIFSGEIGGLNAIEPLITAAQLGVPVLDCDGMGRAFPKLHHFIPFIYGTAPYPAVITDHKGNAVCCVECEDATALENFFRINCIAMGCTAGVCLATLTHEEIKTRTCLYSLSRAWYLGKVVVTARKNHTSPVDAILNHSNGNLVACGKIIDVFRETRDGFTFGRLRLFGSGEYQNRYYVIEFQNEYIIAKDVATDTILATVPDLITVVDSDHGEPIPTDELKYGLRISVLVLPPPQLFCTEQALKFVGPQAFSYKDASYKPNFDEFPTKSIPKLKTQQAE